MPVDRSPSDRPGAAVVQGERRSPDAAVRVERALRVLVVLEVEDAAVRRHVRPLARDVEVRRVGRDVVAVAERRRREAGVPKKTPELHSGRRADGRAERPERPRADPAALDEHRARTATPGNPACRRSSRRSRTAAWIAAGIGPLPGATAVTAAATPAIATSSPIIRKYVPAMPPPRPQLSSRLVETAAPRTNVDLSARLVKNRTAGVWSARFAST